MQLSPCVDLWDKGRRIEFWSNRNTLISQDFKYHIVIIGIIIIIIDIIYLALQSCFVFLRSRIQISTLGQAILTKIYRGFSQTFQANAWIESYIRSRPISSTLFSVHNSL